MYYFPVEKRSLLSAFDIELILREVCHKKYVIKYCNFVRGCENYDKTTNKNQNCIKSELIGHFESKFC